MSGRPHRPMQKSLSYACAFLSNVMTLPGLHLACQSSLVNRPSLAPTQSEVFELT